MNRARKEAYVKRIDILRWMVLCVNEKERTELTFYPLGRSVILLEVTVQQTLQGLSVSSLVAGHLSRRRAGRFASYGQSLAGQGFPAVLHINSFKGKEINVALNFAHLGGHHGKSE